MKLIYLFLLGTCFSEPIFPKEQYEIGYLPIDNSNKLFYWLFKSRSNKLNRPLILWLEGGPGCSGVFSVLMEHGPYSLSKDKSGKITSNPFSWNNVADVLYIDQPLGTGFSNASDINRIPTTDLESTRDLYTALCEFIEKHKEYEGTKFYITGESYGAHFAPNLAKYMIDKKFDKLNLAGILIGNGLFKLSAYSRSYADFGYENNLYGLPYYYVLKMSTSLTTFFAEIKWSKASFIFQVLSQIFTAGIIPKVNVEDIREKCDPVKGCNNPIFVEVFVNRSDVRKELNLDNRPWRMCSAIVHMRMTDPFYGDMTPIINELLDSPKNIKFVFYSGNKDWLCNTNGMDNFLNELQWSGKVNFDKAEWNSWFVTGRQAGRYKYAKNLKYYYVKDAGHLVTLDQPEYAYDILLNLLYS